MDVSVGGLLYADDLTLNGTQSADRRPLVYRFEVTPSSASINITLTNGGNVPGFTTDTNPYVNAVMVTQVPEPSALSLLAVGFGVILRRRRRKV
jgi:PEP-CTERM motif